MKICKASYNNNVFYGEIKDNMVYPIEGDLFQSPDISPDGIPLESVKLLAPVDPTKIVCVGKNYVNHIGEMSTQFQDGRASTGLPEQPELFLKPNSSLNDPDGTIIYPDGAKRVDYEGEIGVIIKKKAKYVKKEDVLDYIYGLTLVNDVSRRDRPASETQWTNGKCYDTFCPVGPWITTIDTLTEVDLKTTVNGEVRQDSTTACMIFGIAETIEFITSRMTLMPGDLIATGTPAGVAPVSPGDTVTISSSLLGSLTNTFIPEPEH